MVKNSKKEEIPFGKVVNTHHLGKTLRAFRKEQKVTLEQLAGISNLSMRFLSELERGKETAELGKALKAINNLGLELIIERRGYTSEKKP